MTQERDNPETWEASRDAALEAADRCEDPRDRLAYLRAAKVANREAGKLRLAAMLAPIKRVFGR